MVGSIRGNGWIITCTVVVCIRGRMAVFMKVNTKMTRSTASVSIRGVMDVATKATGPEESSTAWACMLFQSQQRNPASGKRERESNGLICSKFRRSNKDHLNIANYFGKTRASTIWKE